MSKIIFVLIAVVLGTAASQRSLQGGATILTPTTVRLGHLIQRVPNAVSHQSQTVVHNHANLIREILAPATIVRTVPIINSPTHGPSNRIYQIRTSPYNTLAVQSPNLAPNFYYMN